MGKPTLDLDMLVGGSRTVEEGSTRPFYVISLGTSVDLRTRDRQAAQTVMMGLVGFDEATVTIRTFASLEELDYHGRFEKEQWEIKRVFDHDWRRWMEHQKREEAREIRERMAAAPAPPPAPPLAPADKKETDGPF